MQPLNAFLALGAVDPAASTFAELTAGGYARRPVSLTPDADLNIAATADVVFPTATADWVWSAFGIYAAATGGSALLWWAAFIAPAPKVTRSGEAHVARSPGAIQLRRAPAQSADAFESAWESRHGTPVFASRKLMVAPDGIALLPT